MKLFNWFKKQSAVHRALTLYFPLNQGVAPRGDFVSLAKEGFTQNSVVFACVKEIAEAAASVCWQLFRRLPDGGRREIPDHPVLRLMERPNPLQGKFEFIESALAYLYLSGNTFLELVGAGSEADTPPITGSTANVQRWGNVYRNSAGSTSGIRADEYNMGFGEGSSGECLKSNGSGTKAGWQTC